jgi:DNA polymerase
MQHEHDNKLEECHVFSNMNPSRYMVVAQNPGYNECIGDEPLIGDSGEIFDEIIERNGLSRSTFYITNVVKCYSPSNRKPEIDEVVACEPFLTIELKLLRPIIVVSLGAVAFESLCPSLSFSDSLGKIVKSKFDVNVYPVYHPSPRNMADKHRKKRFEADMRVLCEMIKRLNKNGQT